MMSKIILSSEQQNYIKASGKIVLKACPGSGKTTAISYKLVKLQQHWNSKYNEYQGIACLSFTNIAKDEIISKYTEITHTSLGFPHLVCTIDSFINSYISLPFAHLILKDKKQRIRIIEDGSYLDKITPWNIKKYKTHDNRLFWVMYPPSSLSKNAKGEYVSKGKRPKSLTDTDLVKFDEYAYAVKMWQKDCNLFLFQDSERIALNILKKYSHVAKSLVQRFPIIIIDEAQDISEIQSEIINELVLAGLENIDLVGDPYQAIYEWRDARPDLFMEKYNDTPNWNSMDLIENRRSTQAIVDAFSLVRQQGDQSILAKGKFTENHPVNIFKYSDINILNLVQVFESACVERGLTDNWIVTRSNTLRDKVSGINNRIKPWKNPLAEEILNIIRLFSKKKIKESVNRMRKLMVILENPGIDRNEIEKIIEDQLDNHLKNSEILRNIIYLPKTELTIVDWTTETSKYLQKICRLDTEYDLGIKRPNSGIKSLFRSEDCLLSVDKILGIDGSIKKIQISNIHSIKGMTVDSVLLVVNERSNSQSICLGDIVSGISFPNEKKRLAYVAMSRPQHYLAIAVPKTISNEVIKAQFGENTEIIDIDQQI